MGVGGGGNRKQLFAFHQRGRKNSHAKPPQECVQKKIRGDKGDRNIGVWEPIIEALQK